MRYQQAHLTGQLENARLSKQLVNGYVSIEVQIMVEFSEKRRINPD